MHAYRSWNLVTPDGGLSNWLTKISSGILLLVLATGLMRARLRPAFSRTDAYCWGCWTVVASMTVAKVLSIQYLVWGLPLFLLVGAEVLPRACYWRLMVTLVGVALLSTAIFPYLFSNVLPIPADPPIPNRFPLLQLNWLPCSLLVLRNAALVGVTIWLTIKLWRKPPTGGPPGYTITRSVALWKT